MLLYYCMSLLLYVHRTYIYSHNSVRECDIISPTLIMTFPTLGGCNSLYRSGITTPEGQD